jgi:hypothetical protein
LLRHRIPTRGGPPDTTTPSHDRFDRVALVPLMNQIYAQEWGQFQNHFRPSLKLRSRDKRGSKTVRHCETPQTPYARLLASPHVSQKAKARLRAEHARLNPFTLNKNCACSSLPAATSNLRHVVTTD